MSAPRLVVLQKALSRNVKAARKALGLSQEELALEAEIDRTYVSQIERAISNPSLLVLVKLAAVLKMDVIALLSDEEHRRSKAK